MGCSELYKVDKKIVFLIFLVAAMVAAMVGVGVFSDDFDQVFVYPRKYRREVEKYSKEFKVDEYLIYSIIKTESKFNKKAISNKGAKGLMQVTDQTATWAAKELKLGNSMDIYEPDYNIRIGVWYLARLKKEFKGNIALSVAAYNGGSGNVRKWLSEEEYSQDGRSLDKIPFKETSNYVYRVMENYQVYKKLYK